jgi:hypothetical protein
LFYDENLEKISLKTLRKREGAQKRAKNFIYEAKCIKNS